MSRLKTQTLEERRQYMRDYLKRPYAREKHNARSRAFAKTAKGKECSKLGNLKRRIGLKQWVDSLKTDPCTDCGKSFPACAMDFDHKNPLEKSNNIGWLRTSSSKAMILLEISKCDLVCACCRRIRTYKRLESQNRVYAPFHT